MKHFTKLLFCLSLFFSPLLAATPKTIEFAIHEKEYRFSNYFDLASKDNAPQGLVIKTHFAKLNLRPHYDLYDRSGQWRARGVCRLLCLGVFYSWATEIDVYDTEGKTIGVIDGQVMTTTSARFSIYDGNSFLKGIAYMDRLNMGFTILDPNNEMHILARFQRIFVRDVPDHWECQVYEPDAIDLSIIKIFAAFAVDHQEYFRIDK
jgi:hypothetical protein